jgi:hypothetical protein
LITAAESDMQLFLYWHAPEPPDDVAAALDAIVRANPGLEARRFHRDSAAEYIGRHYEQRVLDAFLACAVPAMQADLFRYCAVLAEGGFWLDADHRCKAPLADLLPADRAGVVFSRKNASVVNGCFGFHAPGHPLLRVALEVALRGIETRFVEDVWVTTGPGIFTYLYLLHCMTPLERQTLDYDHVGTAVTHSIRLCAEVAEALAGGPDALFGDVQVASFEAFERTHPPLALSYKSGAGHWPAWKGSIFS